MGAALLALLLARQALGVAGLFIEPTPTPYIAADYYSYHVGAGIKNQPPVQHGADIKWKKKPGF